jgi:hypothetical protein
MHLIDTLRAACKSTNLSPRPVGRTAFGDTTTQWRAIIYDFYFRSCYSVIIMSAENKVPRLFPPHFFNELSLIKNQRSYPQGEQRLNLE